MTDRPAVSVVIPYYRCLRHLPEALDSVLAQTVPAAEVILANDGSPDTADLERLLVPYGDRVRYLRLPHRGVSATRNAGIRVARGDFVALLDADDCWRPDYLAVQLAHVVEDPTVDVLYPNALVIGDPPDAGHTLMELSPSEGPVTLESLLRERCTVMVSALVRRSTLLRVGGFDESLVCFPVEDFDLWLRIAAAGGRIAYHRTVLVHYRRHRDSASANLVRMHLGVLAVLERLRRQRSLAPPELDALAERCRGTVARFRLHAAKRAFAAGDVVAAVHSLRASNRYLRSRRLAVIGALMRSCPGLLARLHHLRERYVFGVR